MESDTNRWPLERVLDTVGAVLTCTVIARATGGLLSALGVQSFHLNPGATSGPGLVVNHADFSVPTYMRLYDGTSWADLISGLTLLAAVALVVLPRMVWTVPAYGRRPNLSVKLMVGVGTVAVLTTVSAVIGTANWIWNASRMAGPAEAVDVADGVAAVALAVLCAVLCWFALPYLGTGSPDATRVQARRSDQPLP